MEEHEAVAAMLGGEVTEGDVREVAADEVKVADDGKPRRRRRKLLLLLLVVAAAAAAMTTAV
jgi:hypothetical protein